MAWNEPGGDKKKDPWGGGGNDSPPDLDELARKMRDRMNKFFGGKGGGSGKKGAGMSLNFGLIAIVAVLAWGLRLLPYWHGCFPGFISSSRLNAAWCCVWANSTRLPGRVLTG